MKYTLAAILLLLALPTIISGQTLGDRASQTTSVEQIFIKLEQEKDEAHTRGDKAAFERLYSDDYLGINARGGLSTKKDILDFNTTHGVMFDFYISEGIAVRVFGDTAVVTGRYKFKYKKPFKGKDDAQYRYTNVYAKGWVGWQIVASQFTRIDK